MIDGFRLISVSVFLPAVKFDVRQRMRRSDRRPGPDSSRILMRPAHARVVEYGARDAGFKLAENSTNWPSAEVARPLTAALFHDALQDFAALSERLRPRLRPDPIGAFFSGIDRVGILSVVISSPFRIDKFRISWHQIRSPRQ
jgi:hypothetical protein